MCLKFVLSFVPASGVSAAAMDLMTNIDVTEALKRPTERGNDGDDEAEGSKDDDGCKLL